MMALRVSSTLSFESMKSTCTFRPASPPCALMYLPHACTASAAALNRPGASGVFTSAMTAIRIVVAVTPTSVALGFSFVDWAALRAPADGASTTEGRESHDNGGTHSRTTMTTHWCHSPRVDALLVVEPVLIRARIGSMPEGSHESLAGPRFR